MIINESFLFERVGDQVVVLDSATRTVIAVSDESSKTLREVLDGAKVTLDAPGIAELIDMGIVVSPVSTGLSRRSVIAAGGLAGAGSVLAFGLPAAAAASSQELTQSEPPAPEPLPTPALARTSEGYAGRWNYEGSEEDLVNFVVIDDILNSSDNGYPGGTTFSWGLLSAGPYRPLVLNVNQWEWPLGTTGPDAESIRVDGLEEGDDLTVYIIASNGDRQSEPAEALLLGVD